MNKPALGSRRSPFTYEKQSGQFLKQMISAIQIEDSFARFILVIVFLLERFRAAEIIVQITKNAKNGENKFNAQRACLRLILHYSVTKESHGKEWNTLKHS
jgi:hypothetical protein